VSLVAEILEAEQRVAPAHAWQMEQWLQTRAQEAVMMMLDTKHISNEHRSRVHMPRSAFRNKQGFALTNYAEIDAFCDALQSVARRYRHEPDKEEISTVVMHVHDICRNKLVLSPAIVDEIFDTHELKSQFSWLHGKFDDTMSEARKAVMDFASRYKSPHSVGRH
jgi:hypothetical protein